MPLQNNNESKAALATNAQRCFATPFGGTLIIYCLADDRVAVTDKTTTEPALYIDGYSNPPIVHTIDSTNILSSFPIPDEDNVCAWRASSQTIQRIFDGGRYLSSAFISGRFFISGNMAIMARLTLSDTSSRTA